MKFFDSVILGFQKLIGSFLEFDFVLLGLFEFIFKFSSLYFDQFGLTVSFFHLLAGIGKSRVKHLANPVLKTDHKSSLLNLLVD